MRRFWLWGPVSYLSMLVAAMTFSAVSAAQVQCSSGVCVTTWHNDNLRTGQNTNETRLTTSVVGHTTSFGKICSTPWPNLDNLVYGQPLVVPNVTFLGTNYSYVAYVTTMLGTVYAIDGTNCAVLGSQSLLEPGEIPQRCVDVGNCGHGYDDVGILSTPVIEIGSNSPTNTGILFAVAASECLTCGSGSSKAYYHRLWALDITSLAQAQSPVQICKNGCGGLDSNTFSHAHYQRPSLLELPANQTGTLGVKMVYVAFFMIDGNNDFTNGFIFGYDAQDINASGYPLIYETTPGATGFSARRGGIWQGGAGLAAGADTRGGSNYFIYTSTGDGTYDLNSQSAPNMDAGDSLVKLTPSLTYPSGGYAVYSFTPSDSQWRACNDFDYGSGGPLLLPDTSFSRVYAVKADKENYLWTTYRDSLGGYTGYANCGTCSYPACSTGCTACGAANTNLAELPIAFSSDHTQEPEARSAPAFWSGSVSSGDQGELYFAAPGNSAAPGQMSRYPVSSSCSAPRGGPICNAVVSTNIDPNVSGMGYAATPSISSDSSYQNGIVWAIKYSPHETLPVLYAFDAGTLIELYDTKLCNPSGTYPDQPGTPTKFSVPTVANGYVYIATQTDFNIYGPLTRSCN